MPSALDWSDNYSSLQQGLLASVFALLIGMERVLHLDAMEDPGFPRLCGGRRSPSRYTFGA
jgi:hypothetical protein